MTTGAIKPRTSEDWHAVPADIHAVFRIRLKAENRPSNTKRAGSKLAEQPPYYNLSNDIPPKSRKRPGPLGHCCVYNWDFRPLDLNRDQGELTLYNLYYSDTDFTQELITGSIRNPIPWPHHNTGLRDLQRVQNQGVSFVHGRRRIDQILQ